MRRVARRDDQRRGASHRVPVWPYFMRPTRRTHRVSGVSPPAFTVHRAVPLLDGEQLGGRFGRRPGERCALNCSGSGFRIRLRPRWGSRRLMRGARLQRLAVAYHRPGQQRPRDRAGLVGPERRIAPSWPCASVPYSRRDGAVAPASSSPHDRCSPLARPDTKAIGTSSSVDRAAGFSRSSHIALPSPRSWSRAAPAFQRRSGSGTAGPCSSVLRAAGLATSPGWPGRCR